MRRLMAVLGLLFSMAPALALTVAEPEPIAIGFEAGRGRLTRDGQVAVDELALRVAECSAGRLSIQLQHDAALPAELATARMDSVRRRLWQLGLQPIYVLAPSRRATRSRELVLATVGSDQGVWCSGDQRRHLAIWADSMGRYVAKPALGAPAFWRRLTPEGRRNLALPLATEAYCLQGDDCIRGRATFHWLVAQVALHEPAARRREWLRTIWMMGEDEDVARLEQGLGVPALTVDERAHAADLLIASPLPWPVIERRLLEPELMKAYGDLAPSVGAGPQPQWLFGEAVARGELQSFARLLDAAGPAKACLVDGAFTYIGASEEKFLAWKPLVASWVRGVDPSYRPPRGQAPCDPFATVLVSAYCAGWPAEEAARFERLWQLLNGSDGAMKSPGVKAMTTPGAALIGWQCRLEPVPGDPSRLRQAAQR